MAMVLDAILRIKAQVTGDEGLQAIGRSLGGLQKSVGGMRGAFQGLAQSTGGLGSALQTLAPALSVAGLGAMAKSAIDTADNLNDLRQKTGITVEVLSQLSKAAQMSGTTIEAVGGAINKLNKGLAQGEKSRASQALRELGISAKDASGNLRPTDQIFLDIAEKFAAMPDGARKAGLAMALFGKSGADMIPMLNMGKKAISDLGVTMSGTFAQQADELNDKMAIIQADFARIGVSIASSMMPALMGLTSVVGGLANTLAALPAPVQGFIGGLALLVGAFVVLAPLIMSVIGLISTLGPILIPIGAIIAGWAGAVVPIIAAIGGALSTLGTILLGVFTGPIGWIALLAAAAAALFVFREPIMAFFAWVGQAFTAWIASLALWAAPFTTWWGNLWAQVQMLTGTFFTWLGQQLYLWFVQPWITMGQLIVSSTMAIWENVKGPVIGFFQWWQQFLYQWFIEPWVVAGARIAELAVQMWEGVKGGAAAAGQWIAGTVQTLFVDPFISARDFVVAAWSQLGTMIMGAWTNITAAFDQYVTQPIQAAWGALQTWMASAAQGIASSLQQAYSAIAGGIVGAFRGIVGTVGRVINGIIGMINNLIGGINRVRTAVGLSALSKIPLVDLPAFAQGGVVNRPTVALVGEGGEPEYIIPESKMAGAAMNYLDGARNQAVLMSRAPRPVSFGAGGGTTGGGGGGVSVNITTGPVLDQGGQKYVTLQDLEAAVRQTSTQIYATLRTPSGRRSMGMA
jgi:TP901 family phage tail tape measure protein